MLKGFKDFVLRGNIVELAIAVVIGGAFTALVTKFTELIINPILARIGGVEGNGLGIQLGTEGDPTTFINIGSLIGAIITFLITALVVYFVFVVPMNKLAERRKRGQAPEDVAPTDVELLTEIRDLLRAQRNA